MEGSLGRREGGGIDGGREGEKAQESERGMVGEREDKKGKEGGGKERHRQTLILRVRPLDR
jgi:hypothetical protein